jgi:hypothetical protein
MTRSAAAELDNSGFQISQTNIDYFENQQQWRRFLISCMDETLSF